MYSNRHFVDGVYLPETPRTFERLAPATGQPFSRTAIGDSSTVNGAVASARSALQGWGELPIERRAEFVSAIGDWLVKAYGSPGELTDLKRLIHEEVGKPAPEADIEVIETSDFVAYFCRIAAEQWKTQSPQLDENLWATKTSFISRRPVGVVAIVKPWNYPLEMIGWSLAPALLCGNTVVIKSSERSPTVSDVFARISKDIGLPKGVLNVVHGDESTSRMLVEHAGVDLVSFTGSVGVGRQIASVCGATGKRSLLELGGNDPAIVLDDVDLELAANGLVWGAFCNAGQVCVGVKRVLVNSVIADRLTALVLDKTRALSLGRDIGPMIDARQIALVQSFVDDARKKGAIIATGGKDADLPGSFYLPTVIEGLNSEMNLWNQECFGPILPIRTFSSDDEAIALANDSDYGLGASVWTSDIVRGRQLASRLSAGMTWINDVNVAFPQAPWGGIKASGKSFELSANAFSEYSSLHHLSIENSAEKTRLWWYPYAS
jgi:acyl-CoA reductase-like NAD-dependent aldehyde dehydrogenase